MSGPVTAFRAAALAVLLAATGVDAACGHTIRIPVLTGGQVDCPRPAARMLTPTDLAGVEAWLGRHRSGWQPNLASPPAPTLCITLNTGTGAVVLSLWPDAPAAGWRNAVLVEIPARHVMSIQVLTAEDEGTLVSLAHP